MKKIAWVFPGQGAQYVGMGKDLYENFDLAKEYFQKANEILGFDIAKLCFEGPDEELKKTQNSQPAIFLVSYICLELLKQKINKDTAPAYTAGLSLGEYTALASAGVFSFEQGLKLVRKRGEYMQEAADQNKGSMLCLVGVDRQTAEKISQDSNTQAANFNCAGQVVLSGTMDNLKKAEQLAEEKQVKRSIYLDVSGPFHSSYMQPAADKLKIEIDNISFQNPACDVISNVTALPESDPDKIKANLITQVAHATHWEDSIKYLASQGIDTLIEIGPGKVLKGLQRRIDPNVIVCNIGTKEEIEAFEL